MNLQPRRVKPKRSDPIADWRRNASQSFASGEPVITECADVSIWRMELPNTSYLAPQAAFWWVSNEKR